MPRSGRRGSGRKATGAGTAPLENDLERYACGCSGDAVHGHAGTDGRPAGDDPGARGARRHRGGADPGSGPAGDRAQRVRDTDGRLVPGVPGARCHAVRAHRRRGRPADPAAAHPGEGEEAGKVTPGQRRWLFLAAMGCLAVFLVWGLAGRPGVGDYPGPYGDVINRIAVSQTNATGVVSAINFEYRGFDTVGEEFILFVAAAGVATVLRRLRGERERSAVEQAAGRDAPATSSAVRMVALAFTGPVVLAGWWLASHAQTNPSGGFQGGILLATAFILIYLSGEFLVFKRFSPADLTDVVEAAGAGGFVDR